LARDNADIMLSVLPLHNADYTGLTENADYGV